MSDDLVPTAKALAKRRHGAGRKMDPFYDSFGTLSPHALSFQDSVSDFIYGNWPGPNRETKTRDLMGILEWSPVGLLMDTSDAARAGAVGDYPGALLGVASAGALGPLFERIARKVFDLDYFGKPVRIWANPDTEALKNLIAKSKYKAMRRVQYPTTGDVFMWDAAIQHYMPWWQRSLASILMIKCGIL